MNIKIEKQRQNNQTELSELQHKKDVTD